MVKKMLAAMAALVIMGGMCSCKSSIPYNIKFIVEVSSTYINENQSDNPMDSRFEEAYDQTYQILCHRLELLGAEFESKKLPETHQYEFLINAVEEGTDISSLRNALRGTGKLEFWLVYKGRDAVRYLYEIDDYISRNKECEGARLFDLLTVINTTESPVAATAKLSDTVMINKMLKRAAENEVYSWREIKFMWAAKPDTGNFISLYAIEVSTRDGSPLLDGSCITDASYDEGYYGNEVNMSMSCPIRPPKFRILDSDGDNYRIQSFV